MSNMEYTMRKELDLKAEQERTLSSPMMKNNFILKVLIVALDVFYGKARTLPKFKILEILARYPYWAWENGGYHRLSHIYADCKKPPKAKTDQ